MHTESAKVSDDIDSHDAVVVGAGSAGLAAAAALQKRGFETVVLESSDAVGARWRSRYEELRLNSWRAMSDLHGYRMPRSYGRYPGRDDFVAYLERYAAHHRLRVRFHTKLVRVERASDLWRLETSAQAMLARYVVIATGWDAVPVLPDWPGRESFVPELIHSSDFRSGHRYADRDVLVVGFGNSGIDIAGHLIAAGARVRISMRTPPNLARREILGLPGQPLAVVADHVPARLADSTFLLTQRMLFGDLTRFGIPRAHDGVYTNFYRRLRSPAIDDGFIAALKQGRTQVVAEVQRLDGPEIVLADGRRLGCDAVICATGFRRGLEPLVGHLGVLRPNGVPFAYRGAPEHPAAPQLYLAGMRGQFSGVIRLGPIHARRITRAAARHRAHHNSKQKRPAGAERDGRVKPRSWH
jgi:putative flavoprotein involved in K+ transport